MSDKNSDRSSEDLIQSLTGDLKAVRPMMAPFKSWLVWVVLTFVSVLFFSNLYHPYPDGIVAHFSLLASQPVFLLELVFAMIPILTAALFALTLTLPGFQKSKWVRIGFWPVLALLAVLSYKGIVGITATGALMGYRPICAAEIMVLSFIPGGILFWQVRKGYPFHRTKIGLLIGVAAASLPLALMQGFCKSTASHDLLFHLIPMGIVALIWVSLCNLFLRSPKS